MYVYVVQLSAWQVLHFCRIMRLMRLSYLAQLIPKERIQYRAFELLTIDSVALFALHLSIPQCSPLPLPPVYHDVS